MEIKSKLLNDAEMRAVKESLIWVSEEQKDNKEEFRVKTLEYIDRTAAANKDMYFFDSLPFVRFIKNSPEHIAYTTPDGRIWLNCPGFLEENRKAWDFVYCHECLHQLWDTFKVGQKIQNEGIEYNHYILNIASDCVINDYLEYYRKKPRPPFDGVFPDYLKDHFNIEYNRKKDTQYTLYLKLLERKNELENDKNLKNWVKDDTKFDGKIKAPINKDKQSSPQGGQGGPQQKEVHSDDYKKGWRDAIKDVLDKKVDPKNYKAQAETNDYTKGYNAAIKAIKEGLENGLSLTDNPSQSSQGISDLADIPWDTPNDRNNDSSGSAQNAKSAQSDADNAKENANKAQEAADKAKKDGDPQAQQKQAAADAAKKAAQEAQKHADQAKDAANQGNTLDEQDAAQRANNAAQEAKDAANKAMGVQNDNQQSAKDAADNAQKSADAAQKAAERAKKAAQEASSTHGSNSKESKDANNEAKKAQESAKNAQKAATAAKAAAKKGDTDKANREATKAKEEADIAATQADRAENIRDGKEPQKNERTKGETTKAFSTSDEETNHPDESNYWDEDIEELKRRHQELIDQYSKKISGDLGTFIKQCKIAQALKETGLEVNTTNRGNSGWNKQMTVTINSYVKQRVFKKKREWQSTYTRVKRGSGFVKMGTPIIPGRKVKEDKMDVMVAFYLDKSGSMANCIDQVFDAAYSIAGVLSKQFKNEQVIDKMECKAFAFDTSMHELKWGSKCSASDSNMSFEEMLQFIEGHTKDYLINVIITDGQYTINGPKVNKFLKEINGILLFISNVPNYEAKAIANGSNGKMKYIEADAAFTVEN